MLTEAERDERRNVRNAKRREAYHLKRDQELLDGILSRAPADARTLIRRVAVARPRLNGLLRAKAEYILLMWKENMPKVGWRDEAEEVIRSMAK